MSYWIYILASAPGGTLYVGMTNDVVRRIHEHREGMVDGFTRKYNVKRLVYFEAHDTAMAAIQREKNIKHWSREWKIELIVKTIPLGATYMMTLSADADHGLPGQARQ